jgi:outer membrane protein OmpA-like peptidoglycan-associated protein
MTIADNFAAEYELLKFATQTGTYSELGDTISATGALTHILYQADAAANIAPLKVFGNYVNVLEQNGFDILLTCINEKCGSSQFLYLLHGQSPRWGDFQNFEPGVYISFSYISASKVIDGRDVYVSLVIHRYGEGATSVVQSIIETERLEDGLLEIDLDFANIEAKGRVILDGLYFSSGQADLLEASTESLEIIAEFLTSQPNRLFYVVGHTDSDGPHELNMSLSKQRAKAVLKKLRDQYNIPQTQLLAVGNGATSPIATNLDEAGKAKNRRVELVER